MKQEDFKTATTGRLIIAPAGHLAFVPAPLPPSLKWDEGLVNALTNAVEAVARLEEAAAKLASPNLISGISGALLFKEAQLSAKIEGTQTLLMDLFQFASRPEEPQEPSNVREVLNHIRALQHGLHRIKELPISNRLLLELHDVLMQSARGGKKAPGQFRKHQVMIGPAGCSAEEATLIPPPPQEMMSCLHELENYIHAETNLHLFVRIAQVHYQFEAIHPFMDGNGRMGRLLITLMLCTRGQPSKPLVYLSAYFERTRDEYLRRLLEVSTEGKWREWLVYFLRGLEDQAAEALRRCSRLAELHDEYYSRLQAAKAPAAALKLVELVFHRPILTVKDVTGLGIGYDTANRHVQYLVNAKIITEITGNRRNRRYLAAEIMAAVDEE